MEKEFKESECESFMADLKVLADLGWNSVITLIWQETPPESVLKKLESDSKSGWSVSIGDGEKEISLRFTEKQRHCIESDMIQSRIKDIIAKLSVVDTVQ